MSAPDRVLFATSNGTGLGHLTRSLAIAAHLGERFEALFLTLSAAAPVVAGLGHPVEYVASYDRPGAGNDLTWTLRTRERFRAAVREARPALVVFDGTHPYERLLPALRASGAPLVWCRRALWRDDADTAPLYRSHLFDAVLEPGEVGEGLRLGPTADRSGEAHSVEPIVLVRRAELLERERAAAGLGLDPGRTTVLVQLGQGPGVKEAAGRVVDALRGRDDVQVAVLGSALAGAAELPAGVVRLGPTYPVARSFRAFDAAVSAAGYNQVHELAALGVPALLVPMPRETDDQAARAREAERAGVALAASGPGDPRLERRVAELLEPEVRERLGAALARLPEWRGAEQAAAWLGELATRRGTARVEGSPAGAMPTLRSSRGRGASGGRPPGGGWRLRVRRGWIFARTVPRTLARLVRQTLGRTRTRARTHVLALGLGADGQAELERALAALDEPPERVLVVTDRLDLAPLVRAGVGFEHVPGPGSRQAELAGVPYEAFRERRLELIRAHRPRPKRTLDLGATG